MILIACMILTIIIVTLGVMRRAIAMSELKIETTLKYGKPGDLNVLIRDLATMSVIGWVLTIILVVEMVLRGLVFVLL